MCLFHPRPPELCVCVCLFHPPPPPRRRHSRGRSFSLSQPAPPTQTRAEAEDRELGPHKLLERLNGGKLPYALLSKKAGSSTKASVHPLPLRLSASVCMCMCFLGGEDGLSLVPCSVPVCEVGHIGCRRSTNPGQGSW